MATLKIPELYPTQVAFFNSKAKYTAFGGAKAGGKSFAVRTLASCLCLKYSGLQCLILRRTYPELYSNHVRPLQVLLNVYDTNPQNRIAEYKADRKEFLFPNSSRIALGTCDNDREVGKHQGQSFDVIFFEEATMIPKDYYDLIKISNRLSGFIPLEYDFQPRQYFTCNPGGVGHQWVKAMFIDNPEINQDGSDYVFIPSKVYDNKYIMDNNPDYVAELESLPEKMRRALLHGDWDAFEGQFFDEFDRDIHVLKEPFVIPNHWRVYRTRDYGLDMLACYWIAVDPENNAYIYKELYEPDLIVSEAAHKINSMTTEKIFMDIAPPDLYNRNAETGKSAVDIFQEYGQYLTKASSDRVNGWLAVKEWLKAVKDQQGGYHPKLRVFPNCHNLIRTLPLLIHNPRKPNDCETEPHEITHAPDALRYFCISWTYAPAQRVNSQKDDFIEWVNKTLKQKNKEARLRKGELFVW